MALIFRDDGSQSGQTNVTFTQDSSQNSACSQGEVLWETEVSLDFDRKSVGWVGAEAMEAEKQLSVMGFQEWGGLFLEVRAKMPSPTCCYPDRFT